MINCNLKKIAEPRYNISSLSRATNRSINVIRALWLNESDTYNRKVINDICRVLNTTPGELIEYTPDPPVKLQIHSVTHGQKAESVTVTTTEPKG